MKQKKEKEKVKNKTEINKTQISLSLIRNKSLEKNKKSLYEKTKS